MKLTDNVTYLHTFKKKINIKLYYKRETKEQQFMVKMMGNSTYNCSI